MTHILKPSTLASSTAISTYLWEERYGFKIRDFQFYKIVSQKILRMTKLLFSVTKTRLGSSSSSNIQNGSGMTVLSSTKVLITRISWSIFGTSVESKSATTTIKMERKASSLKLGPRQMTK
jgi:hypothetical protein